MTDGTRFVQHRFTDLRDRVATARADIESRGLRWRGTRFDVYQREIDTQAAWAGSTLVRPSRSSRDLQLYREAMNQCQQVVMSSELWPQLPQDILRAKLKIILDGTAEPPANDDVPRNTLTELTVARLMHDSGFMVSLSSDADVIAVAPPFEPFVVECKRPASLAKFETNLKKIRRQIDVRCGTGYRHGMGVIAIDRLVTPPESFPNDAELAEAVKSTMRQAGELLRPLYEKVGFVVDRVPCVGFLLVAASDDTSLKSVHITQRLTYWAPAPDARIDNLQTRIAFARRSQPA